MRATLARRAVRAALKGARRVGLFAVGKAAAGMARGAGAGFDAGLLVLPAGYPCDLRDAARVLLAAHPEPDAASVRAAREAVAFFRGFGRDDVILCLVSGGASSLLCLPRPGLTLAAKRDAVARLAASGASIVALNRLRTSLSAVKGGGLGRETNARLVTLVLSDVPGDGAGLVGSGPTIRGRAWDLTSVVGGNRTGLRAARAAALRAGLRVRLGRRELSGEARDAGARFARTLRRLPAGTLLLAGGETTVRLTGRAGRGGRGARGGRCLELALGAAEEMAGTAGAVLLAAASDGIDGSARAAGAFADGETVLRARRMGLDADSSLRGHSTEDFFGRAGGLLVTGPTGTNVRDWVFGLRFLSGRR